jgi:hypothetical protein
MTVKFLTPWWFPKYFYDNQGEFGPSITLLQLIHFVPHRQQRSISVMGFSNQKVFIRVFLRVQVGQTSVQGHLQYKYPREWKASDVHTTQESYTSASSIVNHFDWSHRSQGNEETLLVVRSWKIENEWQLETLGADGVNKMNS